MNQDVLRGMMLIAMIYALLAASTVMTTFLTYPF